MTLSEFVTKTNYALRGQDDDAPTSGDDEYTAWVSTLNSKKDEYYFDIKQRWSESFKVTAPNEPGTVATTGTTTLTGTSTKFTDYQSGDKLVVSGETVRTIDTITSDTSLTVTVAFSNTASGKTFTHSSIIASGDESYSLHRSFLAPSDKAYVTKTNGDKVYFSTEKPQERLDTIRHLYISGLNPKVITFSTEIESTDSIIGATLTVPGYYLPSDISEATDILPFSNPEWAVYAVAAEIAFNDVVYETKAADLVEKANNLYRQAAQANRAGTYGNGRKIAYNVKRIESPTRR